MTDPVTIPAELAWVAEQNREILEAYREAVRAMPPNFRPMFAAAVLPAVSRRIVELQKGRR